MLALESSSDLSADVGVAASICGVISAFENAAAILQRVNAKRAAKKTQLEPLPLELEDSIAQAPGEIDRERSRGVSRFGQRFEAGDLTAVVQLQHVTIQLQNNLMNRLRDAEDDDVDIFALTDAADLGRDNTITALMALRQRLSRVEGSRPIPLTARAPSMVDVASPATAASPQAVPSSSARPVPIVPEQYHQRSSFSLPSRNPPSVPYNAEWSFGSPSPSTDRPSVIGRAALSTSVDHDDHSDALSTTSSGRERASRVDSVQSRQSVAGAATCPPLDTAQTRTISHDSSLSANYSLNLPSTSLYPSQSNNYLGFCKTAWKLQCGDEKAFTKSKDFSQSAQSNYYFLSCSKFRCDFRGKGVDALTNKAITNNGCGLKYRWSFLAKSHVFVKSVRTEGEYSYLCMFCAFTGLKPVVMNLAALLSHISLEHSGGRLSDVILDRTHCIDNRIAKDTEKFDINLFPVMNGGAGGSRRSTGIFEMDDPRTVYSPVELSARQRSVATERIELDA